MFLLDKRIHRELLHKACLLAREKPGSEICGLLIDTRHFVTLVEVRNISRKLGSFVLSSLDVRRVVRASRLLHCKVIGTFHSHPLADGVPGPNDIMGAVDDSLMLIFDCTARQSRLWRIRKNRAQALCFDFTKK